MFTLNPHEVEAVSLSGKASPAGGGAAGSGGPLPVPAGGRSRAIALITGERIDAGRDPPYVIEVDLPQSGIGEIAFAASAKLEITASSPVGPWVAFELFDKLAVDSARWDGGEPATVFKGKDSSLLWVRLGPRLQAGRGAHAHSLVSRRPDRPDRRLLPHQGLGGLVPALARGSHAGHLRPHLQHAGPLPARQRRGAARFQPERARGHHPLGHTGARSGTRRSISGCSRTTPSTDSACRR